MMDYYFYIEPYTLFFRKENECLFYNTLNKKALKMELTDDVRPVFDQLEVDKYVTLSDNELHTEAVSSFVDQLKQTFNGDILPASEGSVPPAIFLPYVNNQREFEKLNTYEWLEKDGQVMNYLEEVYLYLNGCRAEEDDGVWKQISSYLCSSEVMDSNQLINWLGTCADKQINQICLLGGDVLMYPDLDKIWEILQRKSMSIHLYYRYDLFLESYKEHLDNAVGQLTFVIPVWKFDEKLFVSLTSIVKRMEQKKRWLFLIASEKDFEIVEELMIKHPLENSCIKPVYTGDNLPFFKEAVYLEESDVWSTCLEKRDFYVSQKINKNDFGRLTVLPGGKVYANVNYPEIGSLDGESIASILYAEMTEGHSWLRVREQGPCCDCIYQWLCPSPSNYELVIGKPNLCCVKP